MVDRPYGGPMALLTPFGTGWDVCARGATSWCVNREWLVPSTKTRATSPIAGDEEGTP